MGFELCGDSTLQYFGQKGEIGNEPKVQHDIRTESRFFEDGVDSRQFE